MEKDIVIIGGGIIGLSCAYFLNKSGHQVTVIDKSKMSAGASFVNAGYLSPSHLIPLSAPGVMQQGLKWMLNAKSPLYMKPRLDRDFLQWAWAFNKSCTHKHVRRSVPIMKEIAVLGRDLYSQIKKEENFSFHLDKKGLFMLCQTEKALHHEDVLVREALAHELEAQTLTAAQVHEMMPEVVMDIIGASYFKCDHHTTPGEFMTEFTQHLEGAGVTFQEVFIKVYKNIHKFRQKKEQ